MTEVSKTTTFHPERYDKFGSNSFQRLNELVEQIRDKRSGFSPLQSVENFKYLLKKMNEMPELCQAIKKDITKLFNGTSIIRSLTETGMVSGDGLLTQAKNVLVNKFLPEYRDRGDILYWVDRLFDYNSDYLWIDESSDELWSEFFYLLDLHEIFELNSESAFLMQIFSSLKIISTRLNALSINPLVVERIPEIERLESPFIVQYQELCLYLEKYIKEDFDRTTRNRDYLQVIVLIEQCESYISKIRNKKKLYGVTPKLTNYLLRLNQNLKRFRLLLYLITEHKDNRVCRRYG
jgi:site-specific recombinase